MTQQKKIEGKQQRQQEVTERSESSSFASQSRIDAVLRIELGEVLDEREIGSDKSPSKAPNQRRMEITKRKLNMCFIYNAIECL